MQKVRDHCHYTREYRGAAHSVCNLQYKTSKTIPVVFHNGSSYDNHFLIRQLAKDFKGYFSCIGENTEKYISFSISIFKESDKDNKKKKTGVFKLEFIDSNRFMQGKLEDHVENLSERGKNIANDVLQERFYNTHQLCNNDLDKFELLLRKGVYPYTYMDGWKRLKEDMLPDKESFYSELNKEHITNDDYAHAQKVYDTFNIKNLGEYHDLYVQSDTALLADVFENFRDKCLNINKLDPAGKLISFQL